MGFDAGKDVYECFAGKPYNIENAWHLISAVNDVLSRFNSITVSLGRADNNGFPDQAGRSEIENQRNILLSRLAGCRRILSEYLHAGRRKLEIIKRDSERIKNDEKLLNSRSVIDMYTDSEEGLYGLFRRHKELVHRIRDVLDLIQKTVKPDSAANPPKTSLTGSDLSALSAECFFDMEAQYIGLNTSQDSAALEKSRKQLLSSYMKLPEVDSEGFSRCPFAEDLYAEKEESQRNLHRHLEQLRSDKKKLLAGIRKSKSTAAACDDQELRIHSRDPFEADRQAQDRRRLYTKMLREHLLELQIRINDLEILLGITGRRSWPGREPEQGRCFDNYSPAMINKAAGGQKRFTVALADKVPGIDSVFDRESSAGLNRFNDSI
jgi:hypothetical protein